eukprot:6491935-Amphidinium_carterae.2
MGLDYSSLVARNGAWSSQSPETFALQPLVWNLVLRNVEEDINKTSTSWQCQFLYAGTMLHSSDARTGGLVLQTTPHGALVWKMTRVGQGTNVHWMPTKHSNAETPWHIIVVSDLSTCVCIDVEAVPPNVMMQSSTAPDEVHGRAILVSKKRGMRDNAFVFAAKRAFEGVQVQYLKKLVHHLAINTKGAGTLTEKTCLELLLRRALPTASDESISSLVERRMGEVHTDPAAPEHDAFDLDPSVDYFGGVTDEESKTELEALIREELTRRKDLEQRRLARIPVAKTKESHDSALVETKGSRVDLPPVSEHMPTYSLEHLNTLIPPGAKIRREVRTGSYQRYLAEYHTSHGTTKTSKCWSRHFTEHHAALFLIAWLWERHAVETGVSCPYIIPDLLRKRSVQRIQTA